MADKAPAFASVQGYGLKSEQHREAGWVYPGSGGTHDSRQGSLVPGTSLLSDDGPDAGESTLSQPAPSIQHATCLVRPGLSLPIPRQQ